MQINHGDVGSCTMIGRSHTFAGNIADVAFWTIGLTHDDKLLNMKYVALIGISNDVKLTSTNERGRIVTLPC